MKRLILFLLILFSVIEISAQTLCFPETSWFKLKDEQARLYSVEIHPTQTLITIQIQPTHNRKWMRYWTSRKTVIKASNGQIELPILGFVTSDDEDKYYSVAPFSGEWGWSKVKKDRIYHYTMVFDGTIPPGITEISLYDNGDPILGQGYGFANITIDNPHSYGSEYNTDELIYESIDATANDPYVGIYDEVGDMKYKLACVKEGDVYYLLYMSDKKHMNWWKTGDVMARLINTATPGLFKAEWVLVTKRLVTDDAYITFDTGTMTAIVDNVKNTYIKMYPQNMPTSKNNDSNLKQWTGSGFALLNGIIVTNYHVVDGAKSIIVRGMNNGDAVQYNAIVVASDKYNDLALLKISNENFSGFVNIPYNIKTSTSEVGEEIYVLGYPKPSFMGDEIKLTTGVISAKTGFQGDVSIYQISAPIQPGNSGGPLFNKNGEVIGIVSSKFTGGENVGYAIKASYLKNLVETYSSDSILPRDNTISDLPLTDNVKIEKNYIYFIECSNQ